MRVIPASMPEGRPGQMLAVAAPLAMLLAVIFGLFLPALQWYGARQERLDAGRQEIADILAQQKLLPQLRQRALTAAQASATAQILLAGNSDAIADANLQSVLTILSSQAGTSLTSTAVLPGQMSGVLRRVGLAVNVTASWAQLTDFLALIENARPRMIVDDLNVSSADAAGAAASFQASFSVLAFRSTGSQ